MCTRDCSSRSDTSVCSKETMACTSSGSMADSAHCITGPTRPTGMEHSNCHSISACDVGASRKGGVVAEGTQS